MHRGLACRSHSCGRRPRQPGCRGPATNAWARSACPSRRATTTSWKCIVRRKDAGKIKKRVVRFHLNRNLGRKIKSISRETFPEDGVDALIATGKLVPNMEMTHAVRVISDEEPVNASGQLPTSVFLVGKRKGVYHIGLVVRTGFDDD